MNEDDIQAEQAHQRKLTYDLTLVVGKVLAFLDKKYPGIKDAIIEEAKQESDALLAANVAKRGLAEADAFLSAIRDRRN